MAVPGQLEGEYTEKRVSGLGRAGGGGEYRTVWGAGVSEL